MIAKARERADKYSVSDDYVLPDIVDVSPRVHASLETDRIELRSDYYDTARLDLARNDVTLHRRRGALDPGWQLKLPAADRAASARTEIAIANDGTTVPTELRELVVGIRQGRPLKKVARLEITRDVERLVAEDGRVLAIVSDDDVYATDLNGDRSPRRWREIEVELGDAGDEDIRQAIGDRLVRAGAHRRPTPSKLGHFLDRSSTSHRDKPPKSSNTAAQFVGTYLNRQATALVRADVALRVDTSAIDETVLATRRLRSVLRTFGNFFDSDRVGALGTDLRWYSRLLRQVRDAEALRSRVAQRMSALPGPAAGDTAAARIDGQLRDERDRRHAALVQAMASRRYRDLLADLLAWIAAPPATSKTAAENLVPAVCATQREVGKRMRDLDATDADSMDRARKALGRALDVTEMAKPLLGNKRTKPQIRRYFEIRSVLDERRDALAAAEFLLGLEPASTPDAFAYGAVYAIERDCADRASRRATDMR